MFRVHDPCVLALLASLPLGAAPAAAGPLPPQATSEASSLVHPGFATFPVSTPPHTPPELTKPLTPRGRLEPGYFLVHFRSAVTDEDKAWLEGLVPPPQRADGSPLARWYVPDDAYVVWVGDGRAWRSLDRSERTDWVGRYQPAYKLDPELLAEALDPFARPEPVLLNLDLAPGHAPERVVDELSALGVRVLEHAWYPGVGPHDVSFLVVEAPPRTWTALAWIEGVRTVQRRGARSPLADEGYPAELDGAWMAELAGRAQQGEELLGRLSDEHLASGYDEVSAFLDLLSFEHPEALTCLERSEFADPAALEAPVKNGIAVGFEGLPGGSSVPAGSSAALRKALALHAVNDPEADLRASGRFSRARVRRIERDVPRERGFASPTAEARTLELECRHGAPLAVTLAWTDEPGRTGTGKKLINDLDLIVRAPDGTTFHGNRLGPRGESLPGGHGDSHLNAERVVLLDPAEGLWSISVQPVRGSFAVAQGYALVASGEIEERPIPTLGAGATMVLNVAAAIDSKNGPLSALEIAQLGASDDVRWSLRDRESLTLSFEQTLPAEATVQALRVLVEHHESARVRFGEIQWKTAGQALAAPIHESPDLESVDAWPLAAGTSLGDLLLVIENASTNDPTQLDHVFVEVDYTLPDPPPPPEPDPPTGVPPHIVSTPSLVAEVGQPYAYDADGTAEASGTGPLFWATATPPPGFAINPGTGQITWTPVEAGSFPIRIRARNDFGAEIQSFTVVVAGAPLPPTVLPANPTPLTYVPPERLALGAPKTTQYLNVFLPTGLAPLEGWPVVLSTQAGGGIATPPLGSLMDTGFTSPLHDFLASGVAVVDFGVIGVGGSRGLFYPPGHPSGRYESFSPDADMPEKDAVWAVQWLKTQGLFPLDPRRVCMRGSSQGAILAAWAAMGEDRAAAIGSAQVMADTRVNGVLALRPPTSVWAFDQSVNINTRMVSHYEQDGAPGVPATAFGQVSVLLQKSSSIMGFSFLSDRARANNAAQPVCLLYDEPVKLVNGFPADMSVGPNGFPNLHDVLGQPYIHDSWAGYVFWNQLNALSPEAAAFHAANSIFAVRGPVALPPPDDTHTATFAGTVFGPDASAIAHAWVLRTLGVSAPLQISGAAHTNRR